MLWNPQRRVAYLPELAQGYFREEAGFLLHDLEENRLEVVLIPAPEPMHRGHKIRAVQNSNPDWYRSLYWEKPRIYRYLSLPSLKRIAEGRDGNFNPRNWKYHLDTKYRDLIYERLTKGYTDERQGPIAPFAAVRRIFDLPFIDGELEGLEQLCLTTELPMEKRDRDRILY